MSDTCRICGDAQVTSFKAFHGRYLRCRSCKTIARAITQAEYAALEPTYDPGPNVAHESSEHIRTFLMVDSKKELLSRFVSRLKGSTRTVLDIGCGAGGYLLAAQELGCKAVGLEPSLSHSTVGRNLGLDITTGYFGPGTYADESFDIVVLSHVIEHVYEPKTFLESLFKLVKPGGFLIVMTPNADSLVARMSGRHWVMLRPVDHVSMLSEQGFRAMGIHAWGTATFHQSEWVWEPLASLASAALGAVRPRRSANPPPASKDALGNANLAAPPVPSMRWRQNLAPVRAALSVLGFPLHQLAQVTNKQACLTVELQKAGTFAASDRTSSNGLTFGLSREQR